MQQHIIKRILFAAVYLSILNFTTGCLDHVDYVFGESNDAANDSSNTPELGAFYNDESMEPCLNDYTEGNPLSATCIDDVNNDGYRIASQVGGLSSTSDVDWWSMRYVGARFYPGQEFYFGFYGPGKIKISVYKKPTG